MINYVDVGKRVKKLREDKNITIDELASEIKQTSQFVSRIEKGFGLGEDDLQVAVAIALALDSSLDYLLQGKDAPTLKSVIMKHMNVQ